MWVWCPPLYLGAFVANNGMQVHVIGKPCPRHLWRLPGVEPLLAQLEAHFGKEAIGFRTASLAENRPVQAVDLEGGGVR